MASTIGAATPAIQGLLDRHLIFILGCQRSGTTLTGQMLGAHPNAVLLDEPDGAPEWFLANRPTIADAEAALSEVIAKSRSKYGDPDSRYSGSRALADSVTHVAIKAPNLTYWPKTIEAWSGPKSVIFPVRDPRAVAGSMMRLIEVDFVGRQTGLIRLANRAAMPAEEVDELMLAATPLHVKRALIWRIKNAMFDAFREIGLAPLRFRYEDLVGSPAATLARIADHAGLSLDPAMLEHHGVYTGYGPGRTSRERAVDKSSLQSWRDWLTEEQATEVVARAGPLADAVGYRATEASPRAPPHLDAGMQPPVVLTGRGGSGTRLLSKLAEAGRVFLGADANESGDSVEWVDLIYPMARAAAERRRDGIATFPEGAAEALRDYARGLVAKAGARPSAWGLKLPEAMMVLPELNEAFPGMRLIHLVRHPVAIALRRTHVTSRSNNPVGAAVLEAAYREADLAERLDGPRPPWLDNVLSWIFQVGPASRFGREVLGPERYLEIRYEDLCADQEAQEARISDFLGRRVALDESLSAEAIRPPGYAPDDPRIEHIWPLCRRTARPLGYERDLPGDASDDAARARA